VIFDSVDGAGTDPPRLSRQKIRHEIESLTSRHSDSYPSFYWNFRNIIRRYTSIGMLGRPNTMLKCSRNGAKNGPSSSYRSTCSNNSAIRRTSSGSTGTATA